MALTYGIKYHFGLGFDAGRLPEGWTLIESKSEFARAVDPDDQEHLLLGNHASPTFLKNGIRTVDSTIKIPLQPPTT